MSMRVTMRNNRRSEDGLSILLVGTTYTVSDEFGQALVQANHATDTDGVISTEDAAARDALLPTEVRATRSLVSGGGVYGPRGKKTPSMAIGWPDLSLADVTAIAGSPTITLETAPNGQPAIKIVTGVGAHAEVAFPGLVGAPFFGDGYVTAYGTRSQTNADVFTFYVSENDNAYTNGINQIIQFGLATPLQSAVEQGGANTYYFRKARHSNFGAGCTYPSRIGQCKLRVTPLAATSATVWIHAVGIAAPQPKGRVCVVTDDGYDSFMRLGYESFASRGIPVTLGAIGNVIGTGGNYATLKQLQAFVEAGNAIVPHGPWPIAAQSSNIVDWYSGSVADAMADVRLCRDWISANGLGVPNFNKCYVWPQGKFQSASNSTAHLDAMLAEGFVLGRGVGLLVGGAGVYNAGQNIDAMSKYNKLAVGIFGHLWAGTTAAEATNITAITTAVGALSTSRADGMLMFHRVLPSNTADGTMGAADSITIRASDLDTIAGAIKTGIDAGTLEAVTMPQLAADNYWRRF